jgi:hypothetical protein
LDPRTLTLKAGVLPMIGEPHLPDQQSDGDRAWYAMPRAIPLRIAMEAEPLEKRVGAIATVAQTLAGLVCNPGAHFAHPPGPRHGRAKNARHRCGQADTLRPPLEFAGCAEMSNETL